MCDPLTLIMGGLSAAGALFSATKKPPAPPAPVIPATPAPNSRQPGATVRVGAKADKAVAQPDNFVGFTEQRKQGKSLGGFGRSGLTI